MRIRTNKGLVRGRMKEERETAGEGEGGPRFAWFRRRRRRQARQCKGDQIHATKCLRTQQNTDQECGILFIAHWSPCACFPKLLHKLTLKQLDRSIDRSIVRRLGISKYPKSKPSHPASQLLNSHLPPCCCFSLASNWHPPRKLPLLQP
jgi:hypothetical protein